MVFGLIWSVIGFKFTLQVLPDERKVGPDDKPDVLAMPLVLGATMQ